RRPPPTPARCTRRAWLAPPAAAGWPGGVAGGRSCAPVGTRGSCWRRPPARGSFLPASMSCVVEAPVPRLVDDAVRVVARIAHVEPVRGGVATQPLERGGGFERFLPRRLPGAGQVQRPAGMGVAGTRRGVDRQDPGPGLPPGPPPLGDAGPVRVAAVAGDGV